MTGNKKYVKYCQALITKDDPQRLEEIATITGNKVDVPFQYAKSWFAALMAVKSMGDVVQTTTGVGICKQLSNQPHNSSDRLSHHSDLFDQDSLWVSPLR